MSERTWRYSTWGGSKATVVADSVEFTPTHVVWRDVEGSVVLAERPENVNELAQVGTLGSATRGVRPAGRRVEELHVSDEAQSPFCSECGHSWPCQTLRALDGGAT